MTRSAHPAPEQTFDANISSSATLRLSTSYNISITSQANRWRIQALLKLVRSRWLPAKLQARGRHEHGAASTTSMRGTRFARASAQTPSKRAVMSVATPTVMLYHEPSPSHDFGGISFKTRPFARPRRRLLCPHSLRCTFLCVPCSFLFSPSSMSLTTLKRPTRACLSERAVPGHHRRAGLVHPTRNLICAEQ